MREIRNSHRAVYEANAEHWDAERSRVLFEKAWLDRLLEQLPKGGSVLDLGCGTGEPIARYLIEQGCIVTGVDFSPGMLAIARRRFPCARWIDADIRHLDLDERFAGIVAWDSFFHLSAEEQIEAIPRLARPLLPGGALLLTVGPEEGEAVGCVGKDAVFHASLSLAKYAEHLDAIGIDIESFVANDPNCGGHSVLFATKRAAV